MPDRDAETRKDDLRIGTPFWVKTPNSTVPAERSPDTGHVEVIVVGAGISGALMAEALTRGEVVAAFPEGTTSDGLTLLPFHANLIQAAISACAPSSPTARPKRPRAASGGNGRRSCVRGWGRCGRGMETYPKIGCLLALMG